MPKRQPKGGGKLRKITKTYEINLVADTYKADNVKKLIELALLQQESGKEININIL